MRWPWRNTESELDQEVRYHLEALADGFEKEGMTRAQAMKRARAEFGGVELIKDQCRDESRWSWLFQIGQDLRFGWRMMRKSPAITAAAVLTLALGIGATTAIMTLADAVLWRTMAVAAPEQLMEIMWTSVKRPEGLIRGSSGSSFPEDGLRVSDFFSRDAYLGMRERVAGKADLAGHLGNEAVSTSYRGTVTVADARAVTGNFFRMLQIRPFAGRILNDSDDAAGAVPVVVVTHRFWANQLGASVEAVGKTMLVNNIAYAIAGVLPREFTGIIPGERTDLYMALEQSPQMLSPESWYKKAATDPLSWYVQLLARRGGRVTEAELRAALEPAFAASWAAAPNRRK